MTTCRLFRCLPLLPVLLVLACLGLPPALAAGPLQTANGAEGVEPGAAPAAPARTTAVAWLKAAAERYRAIEAAGGWPSVPAGPKLELGDDDPRVLPLRRRLQTTGDLAGDAAAVPLFDPDVDAAVRRFQLRHGLAVDGVVGPKTLAALDVPVAQRIDSLEHNAWRLESRQADWGQRYIAVNTADPGYEVVEDGRVVVEGRAIVGRPTWQTPALDSTIERLEFNPTWTVPSRILRLEILPKLRRDPGYLAKHHMHWVGKMLRQDPGPDNPLGQVKFLFPNSYDVYLHDTSNRSFFARAERFLSHGCVRVEGALDLARLLLRDDPAWPAERIDAVLESGETVRVELARPMPLHIVYQTAWVAADGTVNFRQDVYDRDEEMAAADTKAPQQAAKACPAQRQAG